MYAERCEQLAASLGGATRMTLSIAVLVMETTGAMQLIVPIMLVIFVSKIVGDFFNEGKDSREMSERDE